MGSATTWFEYELNLANDLARNRKDVLAEMDATGERMARRSGRQVERGEAAHAGGRSGDVGSSAVVKRGALVDARGVIIDDFRKALDRETGRRNSAGPRR
ncbi:MAG: hypothetical protein WDN28_07955 [Chthoniobacter sp.]